MRGVHHAKVFHDGVEDGTAEGIIAVAFPVFEDTRKGQHMNSLHWHALYAAVSEFLAVARQYHFCEDMLPEIEKRLFALSPYSKHH